MGVINQLIARGPHLERTGVIMKRGVLGAMDHRNIGDFPS